MHEQRSITESEQTTLPIETLGAEIKARITAGDKALDKAEQHYIAAGIQLAEAKKRLAETREMRWSAFLFSHARIKRRRADELIAIADGRVTLAELREQNRERVAAHRERKKSEQALRNAESISTTSTLTSDVVAPVKLTQGFWSGWASLNDDVREGLGAILEHKSKEIEALQAELAAAKRLIKEQASIINSRDNMVAIAERQSQEAHTRAMFAEADKERLEKEVARLMDLLDIRTAPIPDNDPGFAATVARAA